MLFGRPRWSFLSLGYLPERELKVFPPNPPDRDVRDGAEDRVGEGESLRILLLLLLLLEILLPPPFFLRLNGCLFRSCKRSCCCCSSPPSDRLSPSDIPIMPSLNASRNSESSSSPSPPPPRRPIPFEAPPLTRAAASTAASPRPARAEVMGSMAGGT